MRYRVEVHFTSSVTVDARTKAEARIKVEDGDDMIRFDLGSNVDLSDYTVASVSRADE